MDSSYDNNMDIINNNTPDTVGETGVLVAESGGWGDVAVAENILNNVNNIKNEINKYILLIKERYEKLVKIIFNILDNYNINNKKKNEKDITIQFHICRK